MSTIFRVSSYAITAPTPSVDEREFATLDAAKAYVDAQLARETAATKKVFSPWAETAGGQHFRETRGHANMHSNWGMCITEEN